MQAFSEWDRRDSACKAAEADPAGTSFTFEAGVAKLKGGQGWADVWKRGFFAWEYKGKHACASTGCVPRLGPAVCTKTLCTFADY